MFFASVIAEEMLVNQNREAVHTYWTMFHFVLTMMLWVISIAFIHYYVHKNELQLVINY
jgi:PAS domain-containing protein